MFKKYYLYMYNVAPQKKYYLSFCLKWFTVRLVEFRWGLFSVNEKYICMEKRKIFYHSFLLLNYL